MDFSKEEIEEFGSRLSSLGGRLGFDKYPSNKYIDIEEFFLDATRFVFADERLARCIENWVRTFGFLIDPRKLEKLIEIEKFPYDSAVLGVFLIAIGSTKEKDLDLSSLKKHCESKKKLTYRSPGKVKVSSEYFDPDWLKFNIATHNFVDESKKNLLNLEFILEHSPELRNRVESDDSLCADYRAFIQREGNSHSLDHVCKKIHADYSDLQKIYNRFKKFGILEKASR